MQASLSLSGLVCSYFCPQSEFPLLATENIGLKKLIKVNGCLLCQVFSRTGLSKLQIISLNFQVKD